MHVFLLNACFKMNGFFFFFTYSYFILIFLLHFILKREKEVAGQRADLEDRPCLQGGGLKPLSLVSSGPETHFLALLTRKDY